MSSILDSILGSLWQDKVNKANSDYTDNSMQQYLGQGVWKVKDQFYDSIGNTISGAEAAKMLGSGSGIDYSGLADLGQLGLGLYSYFAGGGRAIQQEVLKNARLRNDAARYQLDQYKAKNNAITSAFSAPQGLAADSVRKVL